MQDGVRCGKALPDIKVLIAGAGPAGLACAIASALQGLNVDVVDAMTPPIDKACGEGLMPGALNALVALGFSIDRDLRPIESHLLRGIRFINAPSCGRDTSIEAVFPAGPGRGIRRTLLHQMLLDRAEALGVRVHWENSVQSIAAGARSTVVHTNRQSFKARYLVGADGHQSRVAAWAKLDDASIHSRRIGLRQHYAIAPWTDFVEVYWGSRGQAYVTPVSPAEVCVAFLADEKIPSPATALTHHPDLHRRLVDAAASDRPRGSISLGRRLSRVISGNIALIGDASGSVDAVTGEGLALGFRQAAALSLAMRAGDLEAYQTAHRRIHRLPSLMSRALLLLNHSSLRGRVLRTFERHPGLFEHLLCAHIGHSPMRLLGSNGLLAAGLHILTV